MISQEQNMRRESGVGAGKSPQFSPSRSGSLVRAGRRIAAISVLAGGLMLAPMFSVAQKQDSIGINQKAQVEVMLPEKTKEPLIKFKATPKGILRVYDKGDAPAVGAGVDFSLGDRLGIDGSLSIVEGKKGLELEEGSISKFIPIKKIRGGIIPVIYFDKFYRVDETHPSGLVIVKSGPLKVAWEQGYDFNLQFIKYTDPTTGFGIKGIMLESGTKVGYFTPIGKPQLAGGAITIPAKFLGLKIEAELQMLVKISKADLGGRPGDTKMLHIRLVITP